MNKEKKRIDTILNNFQQIAKKPDSFLSADDSLLQKIRLSLKETYDYSKSDEKKVAKSLALPELIIKNFDLEQIWQQIELQNDSLFSRSITNVSKLVVGKSHLIFDHLKEDLEDESCEDEGKTKNVRQDVSESNDSSSESDDEELELNDDYDESEHEKLEFSDVDNTNKDDINEDDEDKIDTKLSNKFQKKSIVDDEFFKLEEMEMFLDKEEKRIQNEDVEKGSESDNESDDLLEEDGDDDEDEKIKMAKFKDFFVAKDNQKKNQKTFSDQMNDDDASNNEIKSSLELQDERLARRIQDIERTAISEKPWQLKGEIRAEDRPQNSLLEEIVEFDLSARPAPIITEQTTLQLEDIIKQRLKDKVFDSVERKLKPVDTPMEYKKKLVLDQEKSKQSLAQIYEKEFIDQQVAIDPENRDKEEEEPELHKDVKNLMKNLFNKLDALGNFHFSPKPAVPELRIVNNLPAIAMEEVAPIAASDAALLAPEEVKNKAKGEIIAKTERTSTDKNRERRKKKLKQRAHLKQKHDNALKKTNAGFGKKYGKEKAKNMLEKLTKESNTKKMEEHGGSKAIKSSKAFFARLQEEAHSQIQEKIKSRKRKNKKDEIIAKKIKL